MTQVTLYNGFTPVKSVPEGEVAFWEAQGLSRTPEVLQDAVLLPGNSEVLDFALPVPATPLPERPYQEIGEEVPDVAPEDISADLEFLE